MKKILLGVSAFLLGAVVLPAATLAATYAYVNADGEVMTTEAGTAQAALSGAPGIHARSGVMLIESSADPVLDEDVSGV